MLIKIRYRLPVMLCSGIYLNLNIYWLIDSKSSLKMEEVIMASHRPIMKLDLSKKTNSIKKHLVKFDNFKVAFKSKIKKNRSTQTKNVN